MVPKPTPPPEELLRLIATAYAYSLSADPNAEILGRSARKKVVPIILSSSMNIEANAPQVVPSSGGPPLSGARGLLEHAHTDIT